MLDALSRELYLVVDGDGRVTWADERAARLGLAPGEALPARCLAGSEEKAAELCRRGARDVVRGWELAFVLDGAPSTISFSAQPVDRLRSSNEVKGRLVASVSHELRTPLHSILGLSRLLLDESDGALNGEQRTQVRFIRDAAEELSTLVNDMLDLSRLDAGSAPIRAAVFELGDFLAAVRGTMQPLLREDRPVELVFSPVPDVALETDQGKLGQIVRNLISNALKFTERGAARCA